jgi:hypothetical protein
LGFAERLEDAAEFHQVVFGLRELDLGGGEVLLAGDEGEVLVGGRRDHLEAVPSPRSGP